MHPFPTWSHIADAPLLGLCLGPATTWPHIVMSQGAFLHASMMLMALPTSCWKALGLWTFGWDVRGWGFPRQSPHLGGSQRCLPGFPLPVPANLCTPAGVTFPHWQLGNQTTLSPLQSGMEFISQMLKVVVIEVYKVTDIVIYPHD